MKAVLGQMYALSREHDYPPITLLRGALIRLGSLFFVLCGAVS
jgi:hypothetical protein